MRNIARLASAAVLAGLFSPVAFANDRGFQEHTPECKRATAFVNGAVYAMQASTNPEDTVVRLLTAGSEFGLSYQAFLRDAVMVVYDNREVVKDNPQAVIAQLRPQVEKVCYSAVKGFI